MIQDCKWNHHDDNGTMIGMWWVLRAMSTTRAGIVRDFIQINGERVIFTHY